MEKHLNINKNLYSQNRTEINTVHNGSWWLVKLGRGDAQKKRNPTAISSSSDSIWDMNASSRTSSTNLLEQVLIFLWPWEGRWVAEKIKVCSLPKGFFRIQTVDSRVSVLVYHFNNVTIFYRQLYLILQHFLEARILSQLFISITSFSISPLILQHCSCLLGLQFI